MIKVFFLLVLMIFVGNLLFLDYVSVSQNSQTEDLVARIAKLEDRLRFLSGQVSLAPSVVDDATVSAQISNNSCPTSCTTALNAALANVKTGGTTTVVNKTITVSQRGEFIIPLGSGTPTNVGEWSDIYTAQGSFDTANFEQIKAFYFEVLMHTPEGEVKAKLYDDTTPFSYDGQVLSTTSNTGRLLSIQVPLISGKRSYHVKLFSTITTSASLDSARIRIVTQ